MIKTAEAGELAKRLLEFLDDVKAVMKFRVSY